MLKSKKKVIICTKCGIVFPEGARVCTGCGAGINEYGKSVWIRLNDPKAKKRKRQIKNLLITLIVLSVLSAGFYFGGKAFLKKILPDPLTETTKTTLWSPPEETEESLTAQLTTEEPTTKQEETTQPPTTEPPPTADPALFDVLVAYANTDPQNTKTVVSKISNSEPYLHIGFLVSGEEGEEFAYAFRTTMPDGSVSESEKPMRGKYGQTVCVFWEDFKSRVSGTLSVQLYDPDTGYVLAVTSLQVGSVYYTSAALAFANDHPDNLSDVVTDFTVPISYYHVGFTLSVPEGKKLDCGFRTVLSRKNIIAGPTLSGITNGTLITAEIPVAEHNINQSFTVELYDLSTSKTIQSVTVTVP